jgi:hypothetical protein
VLALGRTPRDLRTSAMIASGCNPCAVAMANGATVTGTDACGLSASVTISP